MLKKHLLFATILVVSTLLIFAVVYANHTYPYPLDYIQAGVLG